MPARSAAVIVIIVIFSLLGSVSLAVAQEDGPYIARNISSSSPPTKLFVQFKSTPRSSDLLSVQEGTPEVTFITGLANTKVGIYQPKEGSDLTQVMDSLKANQKISSVFPVPKVITLTVTNDSLQQNQWGLRNIKIAGDGQTGWDLVNDIGNKTAAVKVAVVDSGVDTSHPDLTGKFDAADIANCSTNGCQSGSNIRDGVGHGTHVAGIVGAVTNNNKGIAGVGWNVKLMSVKILGDDGSGDLDVALKGITWAADHGAKVINMSFGAIENNITPDAKTLIQQAVNYAWNKGAVLVAAAGNCGDADTTGNAECAIYDTNGSITGYASNPKYYPAVADHVLSVASLTTTGTVASYSEHGNWIDVTAPGGQCTSQSDKQNCILSSYPSALITQPPNPTPAIQPYAYMAGTSMATPHVSGLAVLLFALHSDYSNNQVVDIIKSTINNQNGLINAVAALQGNNPTDTITPTISISPTPSPSGEVPTATPTDEPDPVGKLIKTPPSPYPSAPYCPSNQSCGLRPYGDADCNGVIDLNDLAAFSSQYDSMVSPTDASNANFNCIEGKQDTYFVDLSDFEIWRKKYADNRPVPPLTVIPSPTGSPDRPTATPKPTSAVTGVVVAGDVWLDTDKNGVHDGVTKEAFYAGATLNLIRVRNNGKEVVKDTAKSKKEAATKARNYTFGKTDKGNYKIVVSALGANHLIACGKIMVPASIPSDNRYFYCNTGGVLQLMKWTPNASKAYMAITEKTFPVDEQNVIVDFPLESGRN